MKQKIKEIARVFLKRVFGERFFARSRASYWAKKIKRHDAYEDEMELLPLLVPEGSVCIDVGVNFGQYTYPLSQCVGKYGKVFGFEPIPYTCDIARSVLRKLRVHTVELYQLGLSDKAGNIEFIIPVIEHQSKIPNVAEAHIKTDSDNQGIALRTEVTTLDSFARTHAEIHKAVFIKCDTEGVELFVFRGGRVLLQNIRPIILCEIQKEHTARYGYEPSDLVHFLKEIGYELYTYEHKKLKKVQEVLEHPINYFFVHSARKQELIARGIMRG